MCAGVQMYARSVGATSFVAPSFFSFCAASFASNRARSSLPWARIRRSAWMPCSKAALQVPGGRGNTAGALPSGVFGGPLILFSSDGPLNLRDVRFINCSLLYFKSILGISVFC